MAVTKICVFPKKKVLALREGGGSERYGLVRYLKVFFMPSLIHYIVINIIVYQIFLYLQSNPN